MNDVTQALAFMGAYSLGILTVFLAIYWIILREDQKKVQEDVEMANAVDAVKQAMPGSTVLSYEKTTS